MYRNHKASSQTRVVRKINSNCSISRRQSRMRVSSIFCSHILSKREHAGLLCFKEEAIKCHLCVPHVVTLSFWMRSLSSLATVAQFLCEADEQESVLVGAVVCALRSLLTEHSELLHMDCSTTEAELGTPVKSQRGGPCLTSLPLKSAEIMASRRPKHDSFP